MIRTHKVEFARAMLTLLVSIVIALPARSLAQMEPEAPEAHDEAPPTLIKTYNVSDLMRAASDYPVDASILRGGGGGGGGPFIGGGGATPRANDALNPLSGLIIALVDPNSWTENGGAIGQIRTFGPLLVIVQTEENHAKIQALLEEIRRSAGPSQIVSVHATWVMLEGDQPAPRPATAVDEKWLSAQNIYCDARTVCFSGQTVHLTSGRERTVISDITPIVGTNAVAFDPEVAQVRSGVAVQVAPQLVPGADAAVLDMQSFASEWGEPLPPAEFKGVSTTQPAASTATAAQLDRLNMLAQEMKTTLRVPLGTKYVVGGMTLDPAAGEQSPRKLCLIVEINAVK